MNKTLDFNTYERPHIKLTLMDEARTQVRVCTPTEALIEELQANKGELKNASKDNNTEAIKTVFVLMAKLMNCNLDNFTTTAEELRDKYNLKLEHAIVFFSVYFDFIEGIKNAKN